MFALLLCRLSKRRNRGRDCTKSYQPVKLKRLRRLQIRYSELFLQKCNLAFVLLPRSSPLEIQGVERRATQEPMSIQKILRHDNTPPGQAAAHNKLRYNFSKEATNDEKVPEVTLVNLLVGHLDVTPTGQELLADPKIKGLTSNVRIRSAGEFIALVDRGREETKSRARGLKDQIPPLDRKRARSPSPSRYPVTSSGGGGGYSQKRKATPPPEFPEKFKLAHAGAFATQPLRLPKIEVID